MSNKNDIIYRDFAIHVLRHPQSPPLCRTVCQASIYLKLLEEVDKKQRALVENDARRQQSIDAKPFQELIDWKPCEKSIDAKPCEKLMDCDRDLDRQD